MPLCCEIIVLNHQVIEKQYVCATAFKTLTPYTTLIDTIKYISFVQLIHFWILEIALHAGWEICLMKTNSHVLHKLSFLTIVTHFVNDYNSVLCTSVQSVCMGWEVYKCVVPVIVEHYFCTLQKKDPIIMLEREYCHLFYL